MAKGEFALVRQHLEDALAVPDVSPSYIDPAADHDIYAMLVDAAAQQEDLEALMIYAPLAEEAAARCDHKLYSAIADRAWGVAHRMAGEYDEAEGRLHEALSMFKKLKALWQVGKTLYEMGQLVRALGDDDRASFYYSDALAIFEELGAVPDAEKTQITLANVS